MSGTSGAEHDGESDHDKEYRFDIGAFTAPGLFRLLGRVICDDARSPAEMLTSDTLRAAALISMASIPSAFAAWSFADQEPAAHASMYPNRTS
ncbi:hypothetical protein FXB40_35340 [Bradyrhizobium rifense]|uniref:Uncharacterized protein n=1 Tax=Bradyrhizobium rifense TaxID=515499 RepID=A0A5D3K6U9_9BRAD|nr:hypothetical protein FXB40_35340 [Bradyrhizobium rifense]